MASAYFPNAVIVFIPNAFATNVFDAAVTTYYPPAAGPSKYLNVMKVAMDTLVTTVDPVQQHQNPASVPLVYLFNAMANALAMNFAASSAGPAYYPSVSGPSYYPN